MGLIGQSRAVGVVSLLFLLSLNQQFPRRKTVRAVFQGICATKAPERTLLEPEVRKASPPTSLQDLTAQIPTASQGTGISNPEREPCMLELRSQPCAGFSGVCPRLWA